MKKSHFILFIIFSFSYTVFYGQGCSDAGACTLNSIKPESADSTARKNNQIRIGGFYGKADKSILAWGNYVEYNRYLSEKFGIDARLTTLGQNGNGIHAFGLGDLFVTGHYTINKKLKLTAGTKIPLSDGNNKINTLSLPMDYQPSLGTFDLIIGLGYEINQLQLTLAFQQPLTQNKNEFIAENYPLNSPLRQFQSTNKFIRSGDLLFRVSYPVKIVKNLKLTPGLLPIYHISNDRFTAGTGMEKEITGSRGLTLNGNLYLDYSLNTTHFLQLNIGLPFIVRDARPDGLTRSLIASLEYRINF